MKWYEISTNLLSDHWTQSHNLIPELEFSDDPLPEIFVDTMSLSCRRFINARNRI